MIQFNCSWSLLLLRCVLSSCCCCLLGADASTLPSDLLSPSLQPDLLNFKKGWLTKQYEDGQVSPGGALPFASVFGATVGPGFWQLTPLQHPGCAGATFSTDEGSMTLPGRSILGHAPDGRNQT